MGKIRHIAIRCEDTEKTANWLHQALELDIVQRRGAGASPVPAEHAGASPIPAQQTA